jgi:glycosyltransferase involved in cell wall biosynthesis
VLAISLNGKNHLLKANKISENKISVARLGTTDFGLNKTEDLNFFRIVSCSSFHAYKRVELIIDVLSHSSKKIEWVHFGDGDQKNIILEKVKHLPQNVSFTFMGFQKNTFIMEYYQQNQIDLFINVSETEGIPVSIMEAISFGIPVIATNVGGVAEIVNAKTGFLIDKYFDSKVAYQLIENFIEASNEVKASLKQSSRYFWEQNYNASKNYNALSLQLV